MPAERHSRTSAIGGPSRRSNQHQPSGATRSRRGNSALPDGWVKQVFEGCIPVMNDWRNIATDQKNMKAYFYGGVHPKDKYLKPTSDLFCLNAADMEWTNLTDSLRFRIPDPFSKDGVKLELRRLPALTEPAITVISLNERKFLLLFGGHGVESPTADLIAIDPSLLTWWFVELEGTPLLPRLSATMVAIGKCIYIFGGKNPEAEDDTRFIRTYSIGEYDPNTVKWSWAVSDAPFPEDVGLGSGNMQCIPVYGGLEILIVNGRDDENKRFDLSGEHTLFFHAQHRTFQDARTTNGDFPKNVPWYSILRAPSAPDSALIMAILPYRGCLVPEFWRYSPPPVKRIQCLDLCDRTWELNLDLQEFVAVGNKLLLVGCDKAELEGGKESAFNVAVEIPLGDLTK